MSSVLGCRELGALHFLSILELITSKKWFLKINILVDGNFNKNLIALIDSGADLNCIHEGIISTRYFYKTAHSLSSTNGKKLQINYKLPKAYICKDKMSIPTSFLLVKNITNQIILGTPFLEKIFPIKIINNKGIIGSFESKEIYFQFITEPMTKILSEIKEYFIKTKENQIRFLKEEINISNINEKLKNTKL